MASQWYCFTDEEAGPYSFQELAELIARDELQPADLVRRAESRDWQRVDAVLGLLRAAGNVPRHKSRPPNRPQSGFLNRQLIAACHRFFPGASAERVIMVGALLLMLAAPLQLAWFWWRQPPRFPTASASPVVNVPSRLQQLRPLPPVYPTIPDLPRGQPVPVPGFERVTWLKSPTLSADLLTIVYVSYAGGRTLDDLMIAERDSITEPFVKHRSLMGINSLEREAHPSLSPNGLDLLFVHQEDPSTIWHAQRVRSRDDFTSSRKLHLLNDPFPDRHHDAPQFLDGTTIRVTITDQKYKDRTQWYASRKESGTFQITGPVPLQNLWPRAFLAARGRRAYLPTDNGIAITALSTRTGLFAEPELLAGDDRIGGELTSHDDTIWVSPAEDVLFFCGPGPGKGATEHRKLWMLRP